MISFLQSPDEHKSDGSDNNPRHQTQAPNASNSITVNNPVGHTAVQRNNNNNNIPIHPNTDNNNNNAVLFQLVDVLRKESREHNQMMMQFMQMMVADNKQRDETLRKLLDHTRFPINFNHPPSHCVYYGKKGQDPNQRITDHIKAFDQWMATHNVPKVRWKEIFLTYCCEGEALQFIKDTELQSFDLSIIRQALSSRFPMESQLKEFRDKVLSYKYTSRIRI